MVLGCIQRLLHKSRDIHGSVNAVVVSMLGLLNAAVRDPLHLGSSALVGAVESCLLAVVAHELLTLRHSCYARWRSPTLDGPMAVLAKSGWLSATTGEVFAAQFSLAGVHGGAGGSARMAASWVLRRCWRIAG